MGAKKPKLEIIPRFKRTSRRGPWRKKNVTLTDALAEKAERVAGRRRITFSELVCGLIECYVPDEEGNRGRKRRASAEASAVDGDSADAA